MFTGLIERTGEIVALETSPEGATLRVRASGWESPLKDGESIAVNGICLSVVDIEGDAIRFDLLNETVERTNLSGAGVGDLVNLERAMRYGDRFGGHVVSGHIDGCGSIAAIEPDGRDICIRIECASELMTSIVRKGSIAIDGVSLTVTGCGADWLEVMLIPHTLEVTTLGGLEPGDRVNLEADVLGKYVKRYLERMLPGADDRATR